MILVKGFCLLIASIGIGALANTWYVVPDIHGKEECPAKEQEGNCKNLSEYTKNPSEYFTNDSEMIFMSGNHYLTANISIHNVTNLSFKGLNRMVIECGQKKTTSISFSWSSQINITNIAIIGCGVHGIKDASNSYGSSNHSISFVKCTLERIDKNKTYTAIFFDHVRDIYMNNVHVSNTNGYGVYFYMCWGQITVESSCFKNNAGGRSYNGGNFYLVVKKYCTDEKRNTSVTISGSIFTDGRSNLNHSYHRGISASGIHICSFCAIARIQVVGCNISKNLGGNIYIFMLNFVKYNWEMLIDNSLITDGVAYEGAGIQFASRLHLADYNKCNYISENWNFFHIKNTNFSGNRAMYSGGAIKIQLTESDCKPGKVELLECHFRNNSIDSKFSHGAGIRVMTHETPKFKIIHVVKHLVSFRKVSFQNHNQRIVAYSSVVKVERFSNLTFEDCTFLNNNAAALNLKASLVIFAGNIRFENNIALNGGAINLCESSSFFINNETSITFINNHALKTGGAIYVQESCTGQYEACFFQPNVDYLADINDLMTVNHMNLTFVNNTAEIAGNSIYGGSIARCHTYHLLTTDGMKKGFNYSLDIVHALFHFDTNTLSDHVSSDAYKVLFCNDNNKDGPLNITVIPGKTFSVLVRGVGQVDGPSRAVITAKLNQTTIEAAVTPVKYNQPTTKCSNLSLMFSSKSLEKNYTIRLEVQQNQPEFIYRSSMHKYVNILIDACPWGFQLNKTSGLCACHDFLVHKSIQCFLDEQTLQKYTSKYVWIGCNLTTGSCIKNNLLYGICGQADYCSNNETKVTADATSNQCVQGRTGIACGECRSNHSAIFGSSICKICSNIYLWLILVYLAAGILLIVVISVLDITVANGTIYGFLFYISFIHTNQPLFFRSKKFMHKVYVVLISWLNLDLGIEVCFFNGMTTYHKLWLEFGFILYIWALEMVIVYCCRKYVFFTRICGKNINKVLATVLYVTILKCTKLTFQCFVFSNIYDINENNRRILWSPQTTIKYLSINHVPLFLFAVAILAIIVIFTFSLLCIQFLRKVSFLNVVKRLLPFFETFTGPCNDSHAFWPGMLIFIQGIFHLFIATYIYDNIRVILTTGVASFIIIVLSFLGPHGVYRKWSLNLLELSYTINLAILSVSVCIKYYIGHRDDSGSFATSGLLAMLCLLLYYCKHKVKKLFLLGYKKLRNIVKIYRKNAGNSSLINVASHSEVIERRHESGGETSALLSSEVSPPNIWNSKY